MSESNGNGNGKPGHVSNGRQPATQAHKAAFLAAYAKTAQVTESAKAAGVDRVTVWKWRRDDEEFAKAYDDAQADAKVYLVDHAIQWAIEGEEEYVLFAGKVVIGPDGQPVKQRKKNWQMLKFVIERLEGQPVQRVEHGGEIKPGDVKPAFVSAVLQELDRRSALALGEDKD